MLITFIRHGESTDNLRPVWAGWEDAPLSSHGMNQARALGQHWASTPITVVYCSDLKRAHSTAQALVTSQPGRGASGPDPGRGIKPIAMPLLREQNFGIAEGKPWKAVPDSSPNGQSPTPTLTSLLTAETEVEQVYYEIHTRHDKFEGGESLDDLARRADKAIDTTVWPRVIKALRPRPMAFFTTDGGKEHLEHAHIVFVSHELIISELVAALLRRAPKPSSHDPSALKGLPNTGWTQVLVDIQPISTEEANTADSDADPAMALMEIRSIHIHSVDNAPHLADVKQQAGGVGTSAHDEQQRGIREFFGGGGSSIS